MCSVALLTQLTPIGKPFPKGTLKEQIPRYKVSLPAWVGSPEGWCHTPKAASAFIKMHTPSRLESAGLWSVFPRLLLLLTCKHLLLSDRDLETRWLNGKKGIFPKSHLSHGVPWGIVFKMMPLVRLVCQISTSASKRGLENMLYVQDWVRSSAFQPRP